MNPDMEKQLIDNAENAMGCKLEEFQKAELIRLHENFIDFREDLYPYFDRRSISNQNLYDYFDKLNDRANELLNSLQDKDGYLLDAPKYREFLAKKYFEKTIKKVKWIIKNSNEEIQSFELMKDPQKFAVWIEEGVESGVIGLVPRSYKNMPPGFLDPLRKRKKKRGGRYPDLFKYDYIRKMAKWTNKIQGKSPGPGTKNFIMLLDNCWLLFNKNSIGKKTIRNALRKKP